MYTSPHASLDRPLIDPSNWLLDQDLTFLNHGSFGACPQELLAAQRGEQEALERSPVAYYLRALPRKLKAARGRFAELLGAPDEGLCLVSNASEGVATALRAVKWRAGDEVVVSRDAYGACLKMLQDLSRHRGVIIKLAETPFSLEPPGEPGAYTRWAQAVIQAFEAQCSVDTRLLLIDHITSPTGLIFPVQELVTLAVHHGALSLVDGAHAPGHVEVRLSELKPDFYTGNAHKWLMSPKSCAALYVGARWRAQLNPLIISHGYDAPAEARLHALFDWTGTRDLSAWVVLPQTLDWLERQGGWRLIAERNHALVCEGRAVIHEAMWGEEAATVSLPPEAAIGQMASIPVSPELTLKAHAEVGSAALHPLQEWLYQKGIEVPVIPSPYPSAPDLLRISAQAYNQLSDYEELAERLLELRSII